MAPASIALVVIMAALAQSLEASCCNPPPIIRWPALACIVAMWVLATCGAERSLGFLVLVIPVVAGRMAWSFDDIAPTYLLMAAEWAGYTAEAPLGLIVAALSVVAIVPEMIVLHVERYLAVGLVAGHLLQLIAHGWRASDDFCSRFVSPRPN